MECPTCGKIFPTEAGGRQHHTKVHGRPLPNRVCAHCGESFYDPTSKRTYCDDCYSEEGELNGNFSDAKESTECEYCGTTFQYYPSSNEGVYCTDCVKGADGLLPGEPSRDSLIATSCLNCGTSLERYPSEVSEDAYGSFCDLDCYGDWLADNVVGDSHHQWEGGTLAYGDGWWQIRRAALERDEYQCQRCGATPDALGQNPDVHHRRPVREFDDPRAAHTLDNVVTLCRSCHRLVEEGSVTIGDSDQ